MKIGLDLDGTIYNTLDWILTLELQVRLELGYEPVSRSCYRALFQTEDWTKLCTDLGIKDKDVGEYRQRLESRFGTVPPPELIPGGKEAVKKVEAALGLEKLHIVTNNRYPSEIKRRFKRDGLSYLFDRVQHPYEGKADALYDIALQAPEEELVYVGDLVSDGRACEKARQMGADNIIFCAVLHEYAMNLPEDLKNYVERHKSAFCIETLDEIAVLWGE